MPVNGEPDKTYVRLLSKSRLTAAAVVAALADDAHQQIQYIIPFVRAKRFTSFLVNSFLNTRITFDERFKESRRPWYHQYQSSHR
jgi:hypothetical protein